MKRRVLSWFNHDCPQGDQRPVELLLRPAKSAVVPRRRMDISCPGALPSRRRVLHIHENMANKIKGILPRIVAQVTPATARSGTAGEWELQRGILEVSLTPKLEDASHRTMNNLLAMDLSISEVTQRPNGIRGTGEPATQFLGVNFVALWPTTELGQTW